MKPIKVVFDANVYLAATKANSYARLQLKRSQPNGPYRLFISPEIIGEVRSKLEGKFNYTPTESGEFIDMILRYATLVQPKERLSGIVADADDHIILECVVGAKADLLITADRQLLRLKDFRGAHIAHPTMLKYWF